MFSTLQTDNGFKIITDAYLSPRKLMLAARVGAILHFTFKLICLNIKNQSKNSVYSFIERIRIENSKKKLKQISTNKPHTSIAF